MHNFRMVQQIGTGSYSTVFRAQDLRTHQQVAIKIMKFFYSAGKKMQDIELTTLLRFQSNPCIIKLREHFFENQVMVLVFELAGLDLVEYSRQFGEANRRMFNTEEVRVLSYQVAMALVEMHNGKYMHRDLKPENILIDPQTHSVKLVDFGMSKKWQSINNTPYVATRWYRAPEVILNMPYDHSVDVFALGAVMLQMYLGYGAFPGNDSIDQLNKLFSVTGTPTKQSWPQGSSCISQKRIQFHQYPQADLRRYLPLVCEQGIDLLTRMIKCNPRERITMRDVIQHPFYKGVTERLPRQPRNYIYGQVEKISVRRKSEVAMPANLYLMDCCKEEMVQETTVYRTLSNSPTVGVLRASYPDNYPPPLQVSHQWQRSDSKGKQKLELTTKMYDNGTYRPISSRSKSTERSQATAYVSISGSPARHL